MVSWNRRGIRNRNFSAFQDNRQEDGSPERSSMSEMTDPATDGERRGGGWGGGTSDPPDPPGADSSITSLASSESEGWSESSETTSSSGRGDGGGEGRRAGAFRRNWPLSVAAGSGTGAGGGCRPCRACVRDFESKSKEMAGERPRDLLGDLDLLGEREPVSYTHLTLPTTERV